MPCTYMTRRQNCQHSLTQKHLLAGLLLMALWLCRAGLRCPEGPCHGKEGGSHSRGRCCRGLPRSRPALPRLWMTPYITEPSSSVSSIHRDDIRKNSEATNWACQGELSIRTGTTMPLTAPANGYRQSEVSPSGYDVPQQCAGTIPTESASYYTPTFCFFHPAPP